MINSFNDERLETLRAADEWRQWHSLDDERLCIECVQLITGREVTITREAHGRVSLHCPTTGCDSTPRDWFYHGTGGSRSVANIMRFARLSSVIDAGPLHVASDHPQSDQTPACFMKENIFPQPKNKETKGAGCRVLAEPPLRRRHKNYMKRTTLSLICISTLALSGVAQETKPDNSAKNERDRSGETKTSGNQSNSREDIKVTAAIRRAIVKDRSLTMTAKNVKIITAGGTVTLRGPVKSADEKAKIEQLATAATGGAKIDNQLEITESH
jgi:hyperosmotically inducible periplasmic protein